MCLSRQWWCQQILFNKLKPRGYISWWSLNRVAIRPPVIQSNHYRTRNYTGFDYLTWSVGSAENKIPSVGENTIQLVTIPG